MRKLLRKFLSWVMHDPILGVEPYQSAVIPNSRDGSEVSIRSIENGYILSFYSQRQQRMLSWATRDTKELYDQLCTALALKGLE